MCIHTYIHTCILDLGSFVLDLICILPLDLRMFCFCSLFGSSEATVLLINHFSWHPLNGVLAAMA